MNTEAPQAAGSSRFGWPGPKRQEEFRALLKQERLPTHRVVFQGKPEDFPIIRLPASLPKYRMTNGRTASAQEEFLAIRPDARTDLFSGDPEMLDAQEAQHMLLMALAKQANLLEYFKNTANKQVEPILLDELGFVVNGNRRLAAWRTLLEDDPSRYGHFSHIDVVVLPHCDEKEIDRIEAALQIQEDIKADYTWDAEANMMMLKRKRDGFSDRELADLYKMKESDVRDLIDMRDYAADYLRSRNKENHWSLVSEHEFAFKKLVAGRAKLNNMGEQELFKHVAFSLMDKPEEVGGRLYTVIPELQENLDIIREKLQERFQVSPARVADSSELDGLFGAIPDNRVSIDIPLSAVIQQEKNSEEARRIAVEVIDSQRQLKKDAKTANYLLNNCARANALLEAAVREGLRPESNRIGVKYQIQQIRKHVERIEKWISESDNA